MTRRRKDDAPVVRVGLLGLGTVGTGVADILAKHGPLIARRTGVRLRVVRALVRSKKRRKGSASEVPTTARPEEILEAPDVDVVAELIGGQAVARKYILRALAADKPVVTANKAVVAAHGPEIFEAALAAKSDVYFEASVAGGIPIIRTLREGLASDRITELVGILNGTTNYILDQMAQGESYQDALSRAQSLGFAEADPTLDVEGNDAADKLAILAQLAFGTRVTPSSIFTRGITALTPEVLADAAKLGYGVKLLAVARRVGRRLDLRVHPAFVPGSHPMFQVPGATNAVAVRSDSLGRTLYEGPGAGGLPTGSAVVSDLIEAARNLRAGISGRVTMGSTRAAPTLMEPDAVSCAWYLRLSVAERPGVLAAVTRIFADHRISLATVLQREHGAGRSRPVAVVLTTHPTTVGAMNGSLAALRRLKALQGPPNVVRIVQEES